MKNQTLLYVCLFFSLFIIACEEKGETIPLDFTDPCNYYIGDYQWLPSSVDKIPFANKDAVVFVDSLGNEIKLNISYTESLHTTEAIIKGSPDNETEKIYYCYYQDRRSYLLSGNNTSISITVQLVAIPYYDIPREGYTADQLAVNLYQNGSGFGYLGGFSKIIDQRTFPMLYQYITHDPILTCLGKTFTNVESRNFLPSGSPLYYNDAFGVVCFTDAQDNIWVFDRFE